MAKKNETKENPFNFGDSLLIKTTEQTVVEGYEAIEKKEQGGEEVAVTQQQTGQPQVLTLDKLPELSEQAMRAAAEKGRATKAINIELSLPLHTRLKIACASQNRKIKDIVPEIIAAWVEQVENVKA